MWRTRTDFTDVSVGDEVVVYYDGEIAESNPLQNQYGICYHIENSCKSRNRVNFSWLNCLNGARWKYALLRFICHKKEKLIKKYCNSFFYVE